MTKNWIGEIVKEFVLRVDGLEFSVKGLIVKSRGPEGEDTFEWAISHYYKPSEKAATIYIPSARSGKTLEEAEQLLMAYMQTFTTLDVTPNQYY